MLHLDDATVKLFLALAGVVGAFAVWSLNRLLREHDANTSEVTNLRERVIVLEQRSEPKPGRTRR